MWENLARLVICMSWPFSGITFPSPGNAEGSFCNKILYQSVIFEKITRYTNVDDIIKLAYNGHPQSQRRKRAEEVCTPRPKVSVQGLKPTAVSHESPYQEADGFKPEY